MAKCTRKTPSGQVTDIGVCQLTFEVAMARQ